MAFWDRFSVYCWLFWNSLCRQGCPWTNRDPPVSASQVMGLKVYATTPWTHRGLPASDFQVLRLKVCATILNYSFFFFTTLTFYFSLPSLHLFLIHCKPFSFFFCLWIYLYYISLFFWPHKSLICQTIWRGLKSWLWWLDPAHFLAFWDSRFMAVVLAVAMLIATTLQHFKIPATKQAASVWSQTTLKCSVAKPPPRKSQSLCWQDGSESQHFKTVQLFSCYGWKPKKHALSFPSIPFKCFVAGPLKRVTMLQYFTAKTESESLS